MWAEVACVLAEALTGAKQARRGLWMEFGTLSQSRRGPHISEFSISPLLPDKHLPQEVDARILRLVRPAEILTRARVELEIANDLVERGYVTVTTAERQELEQLVAAWDGPSQSKPRRRRESRFYELVARKYLEPQDRGVRRGRLGQIAVELGLDPETEPKSEHVRYCRETLGYLNRHGRRGPSLGRAGPNLPGPSEPPARRARRPKAGHDDR